MDNGRHAREIMAGWKAGEGVLAWAWFISSCGFVCYRSQWKNCLEVAGEGPRWERCSGISPRVPRIPLPQQIPFPRTTTGRDPRGNRTSKKSPPSLTPYFSTFNSQYAILYHPPLFPETNTKLTPSLKLINF